MIYQFMWVDFDINGEKCSLEDKYHLRALNANSPLELYDTFQLEDTLILSHSIRIIYHGIRECEYMFPCHFTFQHKDDCKNLSNTWYPDFVKKTLIEVYVKRMKIETQRIQKVIEPLLLQVSIVVCNIISGYAARLHFGDLTNSFPKKIFIS